MDMPHLKQPRSLFSPETEWLAVVDGSAVETLADVAVPNDWPYCPLLVTIMLC